MLAADGVMVTVGDGRVAGQLVVHGIPPAECRIKSTLAMTAPSVAVNAMVLSPAFTSERFTGTEIVYSLLQAGPPF